MAGGNGLAVESSIAAQKSVVVEGTRPR
jgi:hypothetical protein